MTSAEALSIADLYQVLPIAARSLHAPLGADLEVKVRGVRHDSRLVEPGDAFVVRRGKAHDGADFINEAVRRGAVALIVEASAVAHVPNALPYIVVPDAALALAYAADAVYEHPTFSMEVVGITGTNGKTTTTHLLRSVIDGAMGEGACGVIGTIGHRIGAERIESAYTTPEADELARVMRKMRDRGAAYVAMEVSSIAIELARVAAIRFRVAAFTNLTQDHLDFHGTMESYAKAKAKLFYELGPASSCINVDDPFGRELARNITAPVLRTSSQPGASGSADFYPRTASFGREGLRATVATPLGDVAFQSRLVGAHNLENVLICLAIAHALGIDLGRAAAGISAAPGVPGRLERCDVEGDDIVVLVDYAHTPDALTRVLAAVRSDEAGRVLCVFGCGGDRDAKKRGPMGRAAGQGADIAVVTNDNPRTEEPTEIAKPIVAALEDLGLAPLAVDAIASSARGYVLALDREAAIEAAVGGARSGDLVLIAGKGHEDYQITGTTKKHFDDREVARAALAKRRKKS